MTPTSQISLCSLCKCLQNLQSNERQQNARLGYVNTAKYYLESFKVMCNRLIYKNDDLNGAVCRSECN